MPRPVHTAKVIQLAGASPAKTTKAPAPGRPQAFSKRTKRAATTVQRKNKPGNTRTTSKAVPAPEKPILFPRSKPATAPSLKALRSRA